MNDESFINQTFWTTKNLRESECPQKIAKLMAERNDEFVPTVLFGGADTKHRNEKFNGENSDHISKYIKCLANPVNNTIVLDNRDRKKREVIFEFHISISKNISIIYFKISTNYFSNEEKLKKFMAIEEEIAKIIEPIYGSIHESRDCSDSLPNPVRIMEQIPGAYWGNYFGKYYIEKIGREKLLSFESYKTEILENGDILILTTADPLSPKSKESIQSRKKLYELIKIKEDARSIQEQEYKGKRIFRFEATSRNINSSINDLKNILNKLIKKK